MRRKNTTNNVIYLGIKETDAKSDSSTISPSLKKEIKYMKLITRGDRNAFSKVVNLYMLDMHRFAYSILGDQFKSEDIVQETCLRLWNKADTWNPSGNLKSWLLRIVHNLCMDELRKQKNETPLDITNFIIPDTSPSPIQVYSNKQQSHIMNRLLFSLPQRQRIALILVYYHGYKNKEAAQIMDISIEAIESLLARGRKKLKTSLHNKNFDREIK